MGLARMALVLECANHSILQLIQERAGRYTGSSLLSKTAVERITINKIRFTCEVLPEKNAPYNSIPLEFSRQFYKVFAPFFRCGTPEEHIAYALQLDYVFTAFPIAVLNNLLATRRTVCTETGVSRSASTKVYTELAMKMEHTGLLWNETIFIHYLLMLLSSVSTPHNIRQEVVKQELMATGAKHLLDLGCGDGSFLMDAFESGAFRKICGIEKEHHNVKIARKKARFRKLNKNRWCIINADMRRIDRRFKEYDVVTLIEVIEHIPESELVAFEQALFGNVQPDFIIITTPNTDYNKYLIMPGKFRHPEHFFEWSYAELRIWTERVCATYPYSVEVIPVGGLIARDQSFVSQLALFIKKGTGLLQAK